MRVRLKSKVGHTHFSVNKKPRVKYTFFNVFFSLKTRKIGAKLTPK